MFPESDFRIRARQILQMLRPRPASGNFGLDLLMLVLVAGFQYSVSSSGPLRLAGLDLITPWLVISAIRLRNLQANILAICGALIVESHHSVPAGMYLCIYLILTNVILQAREAISWRQRIPWIMTFSTAGVWVVCFTIFVVLFAAGTSGLSWTLLISSLLRLFWIIAIGLLFSLPWVRPDAEEPVPQ